MLTKTTMLPISDDKDFPKHKPFRLTIGEYMQMDKSPVWQKSHWTVTIGNGPLIRSPVTFFYLDQADAKALIETIQNERNRL